MPQANNIIVGCDRIDPPNNGCKVKPTKIEKLEKSIKVNGLLQPPGVIQVGERFRIVYGHHRFKAWQQLGHSKIEVRVLPADCNELSISLQENHVREPEDFDDAVARVESRAKELGCSIKQAAHLENVKPAYFSRAKRILQKLEAAVSTLAKENGVGFSILYELSGAKEDRQMELLKAYLDGKLKRESLSKAVKQRSLPKRPKAKRVTVERSTDDIDIKIVAKRSVAYASIYRDLAELKKLIRTFEKNGIPVGLLSEAMKGGKANVVLSS